MKHITTTLTALALCSTIAAQDFRLMVQTTPDNPATQCIAVVAGDDSNTPFLADTLNIIDGQASATLAIDKPRAGAIDFLNGNMATLGIYMIFIPGDTLVMTSTDKGWEYGGSPFYCLANQIKAPMNTLEADYRQSLAEMEAAKNEPEAETDTITAREWALYNAFMDSRMQLIRGFLQDNPDAEATAMWLPYAGNEAPQLAESLSERVRTQSPVSEIVQDLLTKERQRQERLAAVEKAKENIREGAPAPDFTLKDINGSDLTLSSLRGQYVMLDFWGSWCPWCIKGMPRMKEYYAKYAGKLQILGIDCRDTEEKWQAAVADLELPWLHVYNPDGSPLTTDYAIEGYPTQILIDPEGNISKVALGESDEFYEHIDALLGN